MVETTVKDRSIGIIVGRLLALVGVALALRVSITGTSFFAKLGWSPTMEELIGMGLSFLGLVVIAQDKWSGWLLATWGFGLLVQAAIRGNLFGSGETFGIGVVTANALAVVYAAVGLYFALRISPKIR
jgi:hypothetical protein